MSLIKYIDRLKRMDDLIRRKASGTPDEFANKLGISKSMLMIHLTELKELGAPVKYDTVNRTYFYENGCRLHLEFVSPAEAKIFYGGSMFSFDVPIVLEWDRLSL